MSKIHVGTCGFNYSWNPDGLEWYLTNTEFDTVELDASFYRIPGEKQIHNWKILTDKHPIIWSIKVYKSITHIHRLNENAVKDLKDFIEKFKELENYIKFYLIQLPPSFKDKNRLFEFFEKVKNEKIALELRNKELFNEEIVEWAKKNKITLVSVDAPGLPRTIFNTTGNVYLRLHGRIMWYYYNYLQIELKGLLKELDKIKAEKYVYFNNTSMYENAKKFLNLIKK